MGERIVNPADYGMTEEQWSKLNYDHKMHFRRKSHYLRHREHIRVYQAAYRKRKKYMTENNLTPGVVSLLLQFNEDTYTLEIKDSSSLDIAVLDGLLARHPGGPFGSRCSYYLTEKGLRIWNDLNK